MAMIRAANLYGLSTLKPQTRWRAPNNRRDVIEFDKCEIGRDAYPPHDHGGGGIGSVAVAIAWLAFYVIAAIHHFIASGN